MRNEFAAVGLAIGPRDAFGLALEFPLAAQGLAAGGPEPRSAGPRARGAPQTEAEEPTEALAGNLLTGDHAGADPPSGDIASLLCFLDDLSAALGALPEG